MKVQKESERERERENNKEPCWRVFSHIPLAVHAGGPEMSRTFCLSRKCHVIVLGGIVCTLRIPPREDSKLTQATAAILLLVTFSVVNF